MAEAVAAYVIGFCGGSASGKSLLAQWLQQYLPAGQAAILELDRYYRAPEDIPPEISGNYDHPACLQAGRFCEDVAALRQGKPMAVPCYDFATHRPCGREAFTPRPVLILDGVLLFALPGVRELIDLSVFVDAPREVRLARRIERDVYERGRTEESVREQFQHTVEPMYARHVQPHAATADIVISNHRHPAAAIEALHQQLREKAPHLGPF